MYKYILVMALILVVQYRGVEFLVGAPPEQTYLMYAILDLVVDRYFMVLEKLGDKIEALEDKLVRESSGDMLHEIYRLKRNIMGDVTCGLSERLYSNLIGMRHT